LDALNGLVLKGDGSGRFNVISTAESGFLVPYDAKHITTLKSATGATLYVASQNRERLLVFTKN